MTAAARTWWLGNLFGQSRVGIRNQASGGEHYLLPNIFYALSQSADDPAVITAGRNGGVTYWQSAGNASAYMVCNTLYQVKGIRINRRRP